VKDSGSADRILVQQTLGEGLGLQDDPNAYAIFRDQRTGLEYIRNCHDLCQKGLYIELDAYKCHVFLEWREVHDNEWRQYAHLAGYLGGRGVPSIEEALREVFLQPVLEPFRELVNAGALRWFFDNRVVEPVGAVEAGVVEDIETRVLSLVREAKQFSRGRGDTASLVAEIKRKAETCLQLHTLESRQSLPGSEDYAAAVEMVGDTLDDDPAVWGTLLSWLFTHALGKVISEEGYAAQSRSWMDEWLLGKLVTAALQDLGLDEVAAGRALGMVKILVKHQDWFDGEIFDQTAYQILASWLKDAEVQQFLQVNRYGGILWFNHEAFGQLMGWMLTIAVVTLGADEDRTADKAAQAIAACYRVIGRLQEAEEASDYQVAKLMEAAKG
jgi:hypothetical protein